MSERSKIVNIKLGQEIPPLTIKIERKTYKKYNRLVKEINPMHLSKYYVQSLGYDDVLVAGNFLYSFIPKWIINWIGVQNAGSIKNLDVRFENPVYPDDEIIINGKIVNIQKEKDKKIIQCEFKVSNSNKEGVFSGSVILKF